MYYDILLFYNDLSVPKELDFLFFSSGCCYSLYFQVRFHLRLSLIYWQKFAYLLTVNGERKRSEIFMYK